MTSACDREQDVLDALAAGRCPGRSDGDLYAHVSSCAVCADLADVARAIDNARETAWDGARVPPAGIVWWRAQLRAREDTARAAARPVAFIQGVAASVAIWLLISLYRALPSAYWSEWRSSLTSALPPIAFTMTNFARFIAAVPLIIFIVVVVWLVLAPVAIYFAAADE